MSVLEGHVPPNPSALERMETGLTGRTPEGLTGIALVAPKSSTGKFQAVNLSTEEQ